MARDFLTPRRQKVLDQVSSEAAALGRRVVILDQDVRSLLVAAFTKCLTKAVAVSFFPF